MVLTFVGLVDIDATRLIDSKYKNFAYRRDDNYDLYGVDSNGKAVVLVGVVVDDGIDLSVDDLTTKKKTKIEAYKNCFAY